MDGQSLVTRILNGDVVIDKLKDFDEQAGIPDGMQDNYAHSHSQGKSVRGVLTQSDLMADSCVMAHCDAMTDDGV